MNKMNINDWHEFNLLDLFSDEQGNIESCKCSNASAFLEEGNDLMYIGAKKNDNGFRYYVARNEDYVTEGNCIIFICDGDGSVGYHTYQEEDFIGSTTLKVGRNKNLNKYNSLFLLTVLDYARYKFSFGRKYKVENEIVTLPCLKNENGVEPDWAFMENYIKNLKAQQIKALSSIKNPFVSKDTGVYIDVSSWKEFKVENIFDEIYKGKPHAKIRIETSANKERHNISFVTRTEKNNGHDSYAYLNSIKEKEKGNAIIIGDTTATIFYQENDFATGDHIIVCRSKNLNKYNGLFLKTILDKEKYKYSYGRAFKMDSLKNTEIKLPAKNVNDEYEPDWDYMEDFIKGYSLVK